MQDKVVITREKTEELTMKKKIVTLMLAVTMAFAVTACGGNDDKGGSADTQDVKVKEDKKSDVMTGNVDQISLDNPEGTLAFTRYEVTTDYEGKPAILVYFDYTNKQEKTSYAQMTFYPQVFQNGVECQMGFSMEDNESLHNASKEIQKDTTLGIAYIYELQDNTNPVTLKVTDQSSEYLLEDVYQEQELALQ